MSKEAGHLLLGTVLLEGSVALTHLVLGTNKPWLWDSASYGFVAACALYLGYWLEH